MDKNILRHCPDWLYMLHNKPEKQHTMSVIFYQVDMFSSLCTGIIR